MNLLLLSPATLNDDKINFLSHLLSAPEIKVVGVAIYKSMNLMEPRYLKFIQKIKKIGLQKTLMNYVMTLTQKRFHNKINVNAGDYFKDLNIPVIMTDQKYSNQVMKFITSVGPDALFRVGWGIIKEPLLSITPIGVLSYHHGDIRKYRGQPPGFWQLYHNERSAKVTIQILDKGLDCGAIVDETDVPIYPRDSYKSFNRRLYASSYHLAARACQKLSNNYHPQKKSVSELGQLYTTPTFGQWVKFNLKLLYRRVK